MQKEALRDEACAVCIVVIARGRRTPTGCSASTVCLTSHARKVLSLPGPARKRPGAEQLVTIPRQFQQVRMIPSNRRECAKVQHRFHLGIDALAGEALGRAARIVCRANDAQQRCAASLRLHCSHRRLAAGRTDVGAQAAACACSTHDLYSTV